MIHTIRRGHSIFELGNSLPEDTWQFYSVSINEPRYLRSDFRIRFDAHSINNVGEEIWIDDLSVTTFTRTKDYSGHGNDATVNGATWTADGLVGGAYVFDGQNDYMRIGDDPSLGGDGSWSQISLEFWIKPTTLQNGGYHHGEEGPIVATGSYMVGFRDTGYRQHSVLRNKQRDRRQSAKWKVRPTTGLTSTATRPSSLLTSGVTSCSPTSRAQEWQST